MSWRKLDAIDILDKNSVMVAISDIRKNGLLAALPEAKLQRWISLQELVDMPLEQVLYESGEKMNFVYFPHFGHRVLAVHTGKWFFCRTRPARQRRYSRYIPLHGRRSHF